MNKDQITHIIGELVILILCAAWFQYQQSNTNKRITQLEQAVEELKQQCEDLLEISHTQNKIIKSFKQNSFPYQSQFHETQQSHQSHQSHQSQQSQQSQQLHQSHQSQQSQKPHKSQMSDQSSQLSNQKIQQQELMTPETFQQVPTEQQVVICLTSQLQQPHSQSRPIIEIINENPNNSNPDEVLDTLLQNELEKLNEEENVDIDTE